MFHHRPAPREAPNRWSVEPTGELLCGTHDITLPEETGIEPPAVASTFVIYRELSGTVSHLTPMLLSHTYRLPYFLNAFSEGHKI